MTKPNKTHRRLAGIIAAVLIAVPPAWGQVKPQRPHFENEFFTLRLIPRTPDQIAAFYEARGFADYAVDALRELCFITVGFKNNSDSIIWHDLDNWRISAAQGPIERYARDYWPGFWAERELAQRFQSIFRWTLMPEQLDFRPAEAEGGNIVLPRVEGPFQITATFVVGEDRSEGKRMEVTIDKLYCAEDEQRAPDL